MVLAPGRKVKHLMVQSSGRNWPFFALSASFHLAISEPRGPGPPTEGRGGGWTTSASLRFTRRNRSRNLQEATFADQDIYVFPICSVGRENNIFR